MRKKFSFFLIALIAVHFSGYSQDEPQKKGSRFTAGIQMGAFFANDNTAHFYSGTPDITNYGINWTLGLQFYKQRFDNYFVHPYYIAEFPFEPVYEPAIEVGLHLGFEINDEISLFADLNSVRLNYKQFFTMAIDDPSNQSVEPNYERIPIVGKENRFYLNLGTQINCYEDGSSKLYWSLFGSLNDLEVKSNYFTINGIRYDILHPVNDDFNVKPGGIGYGGGTGLGYKFSVANQLNLDIYYNLHYSKTRLNDDLEKFGIAHSVGLRITWGSVGIEEEIDEENDW